MVTHKHKMLLIMVVLIFASLACNLPALTTQSTSTALPVGTQDVQNPQVNNQAPGQVSFTVDEAELTAMLASELRKQPDQVLQNPKVLLRDGHLTVTGTVKQSGLTADLVVTLAISATQDGHLAYQLQSAQLGPFPLPQDLMGSLSSQLDSVFTNSIYPKFEDTFIESVTIANGQMVIQGHPR